MTELIKHPEFGEIRTKMIAGEPWFCGKDVCKALEYVNHHHALKQHCKERGVVKQATPSVSGIQEMNFINEGNLYRLIIGSRLPTAEKFEAWVCDEVLPTIRRTGEYKMYSPKGQKRKASTRMDIIHVLWLIDENLMRGDKKMIALQVGVSEHTVQSVLNGQSRNPRVLMALYNKALENRRMNPYSPEFIERAVYKLM